MNFDIKKIPTENRAQTIPSIFTNIPTHFHAKSPSSAIVSKIKYSSFKSFNRRLFNFMQKQHD